MADGIGWADGGVNWKDGGSTWGPGHNPQPPDEPNRFSRASTVEELIGQAIGAGSVCWVGGTGPLEFDSREASQIVKETLARLAELTGVKA